MPINKHGAGGCQCCGDGCEESLCLDTYYSSLDIEIQFTGGNPTLAACRTITRSFVIDSTLREFTTAIGGCNNSMSTTTSCLVYGSGMGYDIGFTITRAAGGLNFGFFLLYYLVPTPIPSVCSQYVFNDTLMLSDCSDLLDQHEATLQGGTAIPCPTPAPLMMEDIPSAPQFSKLLWNLST